MPGKRVPAPGRPLPTPAPPVPIQFQQIGKKDLDDPQLGLVNLMFQTLANNMNQVLGINGPSYLPAGIDVGGGRISGLGAPVNPTDAVSAEHADQQFGAKALRSQLDVGGEYALKGLNAAYAVALQNQQAIQGLPGNYQSGSNSLTLFGLTLKFGHTGTFSGSTAVVFPARFPTICLVALAVDDHASGTGFIMSVSGALLATGFTIASSGSGNGAYWLAVGN